MSRYNSIIIFICYFLPKASGDGGSNDHWHKYWVPNTKFDNPSNWDTNRVPCANDRAIIPRHSKVSVYISTNLTLRQLVLATDGEIIVGENAGFLISDAVPGEKCTGTDITWKADSVKSWHDPSNWKFASEDNSPSVPVPDTERTPCQHDHIIFPMNSSFQVQIQTQDALLQFLNISDNRMNAADFQTYIQSPSGQLKFLGQKFKFATDICREAAGCVCQNTNLPERKSYICSFLRGKCPKLHCQDPVTLVGSCCPICGGILNRQNADDKMERFQNVGLADQTLHLQSQQPSVITLTIDGKFILDGFNTYILALMENRGIVNSCQVFVSRVSTDSVQFIAQDPKTHTDQGFVAELAKHLQHGANPPLGIITLNVAVSSNWLPDFDYYSSHHGLSSGPLSALILGFLTAMIVATLVYIHYRKHWPQVWRRFLRRITSVFTKGRSGMPFTFARFIDAEDEEGKEAGNVEFAVEIGNPFESADLSPADLQGFGNPMYTVLPPSGPRGSRGMTHENPTFLIYDRIEDIPEETEQVATEDDDKK